MAQGLLLRAPFLKVRVVVPLTGSLLLNPNASGGGAAGKGAI